MTDLDKQLQDHLDKLEAGSSLAEITAGLPAEEAELMALLVLAAALRETPPPAINQSAWNKQRGAILAVAESAADRKKKGPIRTKRPWIVSGLAAAMVIVLFALVTIFGSMFLQSRSGVDLVTLADLTGLVEVAPSDEAGQWMIARSGGKLTAGDRIRTGDSGGVELLYPDGSVTSIGPNSILVLEKVLAGRGGRHILVSLEQGESTHNVVTDVRPEAEFIVHTPGGFATVQGTLFQVLVDRLGTARFLVSNGKILVEGADQRVTIAAGQVTSLSPGEGPTPPAFQFSGQGKIMQISGTTWTISGLPVTVIDQTVQVGDPSPGDYVAVVGRLLSGDLWLADQLTVISKGEAFFQFTGPVEVISEDTWQIGGVVVIVNDGTRIDASLGLGSMTRVSFVVLSDGSRLALVIEGLDGDPVEDDANLVFIPELQVGQGCQLNYEFEANLVNRGDTQVAGVNLIGVVVQGEEYILSLDITPSEIDFIPVGSEVVINAVLILNPEWLTPPSGAEVEVWIYAFDESSGSDEGSPRWRLVIPGQCATPTPTATSTPTPTPTPTPEPSPLAGENKVTICHIPPGNPGNAHTLSIDSSAVPAHLGHGDTLGPCP